MAIARSKVTAQSQISVPAEVRRKLGITAGSTLEWSEEDGRIVVRRAAVHSSEDIHRALFAEPPTPRSAADMKDGIRRRMRKRDARR